jgi:ketosteroid isomerase-like protein
MVRSVADAFNRRDFDAALALADNDLTWKPFISSVETPDLLRGKEEIRRAWASQVEALDLRMEIEDVTTVDPDTAVITSRAIARGGSSGVPLEAAGAILARFRDGRFVHCEWHQTVAAALEAARG